MGESGEAKKAPPAKKDEVLFLEYFFVEIFEIH